MTSRSLRVAWSLVLALSLTLSMGATADAATAASWKKLSIGDDQFYNYDSVERFVNGNWVDWPVTMLFWNNAEVDKVKSYYWGESSIASPQQLYLTDGSRTGYRWEWDTDKGTKTGSCFGAYKHMRLYAPYPADNFYNTSWGYFVLGTTHIDDFECGTIAGFGAFGWSEDAEHQMANQARLWGSILPVAEDWSSFHNAEPNRWEGDHFWQNNGLATAVKVTQ